MYLFSSFSRRFSQSTLFFFLPAVVCILRGVRGPASLFPLLLPSPHRQTFFPSFIFFARIHNPFSPFLSSVPFPQTLVSSCATHDSFLSFDDVTSLLSLSLRLNITLYVRNALHHHRTTPSTTQTVQPRILFAPRPLQHLRTQSILQIKPPSALNSLLDSSSSIFFPHRLLSSERFPPSAGKIRKRPTKRTTLASHLPGTNTAPSPPKREPRKKVQRTTRSSRL